MVEPRPLTICMLGYTGSGKSTLCNYLLGTNCFKT
jgi:predicted GTPase